MHPPSLRSGSLLVILLLTACGGGAGSGAADAAASPDGPAGDAAAALPLPGFGALSGDCDLLDDELVSSEPYALRSAIEFERLFSDADAALLTEGGQEMLAEDNAGGSSLYSEVFAFEVLHRCELAGLTKTETEVDYDREGPLTDVLVTIDGTAIGVSVTRAMSYPFDDPYPVEQARDLLDRKLADILESSANVSEADRWHKQILAVVAYGPDHADAIETALADVDPEIVADTIVWVIVTGGADAFIYCNGPCD